MRNLEYRVTYQDHEASWHTYVKVRARDINSGFTKALKIANQPLRNDKRRELCSIEFWEAS